MELIASNCAHRERGEHGDNAFDLPISNFLPVLTARNAPAVRGFCHGRSISMFMTNERRPGIRTLRGWAIHVLQEAGAIRECEEHGWAQDRADPHAHDRAFDLARLDPPAGMSADEPPRRRARRARRDR